MKKPFTVKAKFMRSKSNLELTKLWDDLDDLKKVSILKNLDIHSSEEPVLSFYKDAGLWWLLTSERLFIYNDNLVEELQLNEVVDVDVPELFQGTVPKTECDKIRIILQETTIDLTIEERSWHVIYPLFKFAFAK
jgi:hypothetical protein